MARLYCAKHGLALLEQIKSDPAPEDDGSGMIITKGKLRNSQWLCDHCNISLKENDLAYFVNFLTPEMVDEFPDYDWADEKHYFREFNNNDIILFGFEWPE